MRHKRFKGCCAMCAIWFRGDGKGKRMRAGDLRRAGGPKAIKHRSAERRAE